VGSFQKTKHIDAESMDPYESLKRALAGIGLTGQLQNPDQLLISRQEGPVWPERGNSFWVSHKQDVWYLGTWLPVCYKLPTDQDIVDLCAAFMSLGTSARYRVPPEIIERFGLQELDGQEYQLLFPQKP
jgi:hypothetical protein